ncbi:MAG: TnpV protein [Oscillospiraceae bacterium]
MSKALPKTTAENGIQYILDERTQTYLPDLRIEEETIPLGKYGLLRRSYLKEYRNPIYQRMLMDGTLYPHLREIDQAANKRLDMILPEMKEKAGITEYLKATEQMRWVGLMNSVMAQAEEIVMSELIYD